MIPAGEASRNCKKQNPAIKKSLGIFGMKSIINAGKVESERKGRVGMTIIPLTIRSKTYLQRNPFLEVMHPSSGEKGVIVETCQTEKHKCSWIICGV